jgi:hypothetical protein
MFTVKMKMMLLTGVPTISTKKSEKNRGARKPLTNIPLRSMLINAGRDTVKDSQQYRSGTSFKIASTGTRK